MKRNHSLSFCFEKEFLNNLIQDESSCVKLQTQEYHLALHPFHLNNVSNSIKDVLNKSIAKYDNKFKGILLGYQNIKLLSDSGAMNNDTCFIHINISAEFYIFKPEVGKVLPGTVNKKSQSHVSCLLYNIFNVTLPKPDDDEDWMGLSANIGQEILFRITFIDLDGKLPYIKADFVSILSENDSGISTSEETKKPNKIIFNDESEEEQEVKVTKRKKRKDKTDSDVEEKSVNETFSAKKARKKTKTIKEELYLSLQEEEESVNEASSSKKSKKKETTVKEELYASLQEEEEPEADKMKKEKRKKKHQENLSGEEDPLLAIKKELNLSLHEEGSEVNTTKKKKKKHKTDQDEDDETDVSQVASVEKSKKKKHELHNETITSSVEHTRPKRLSFPESNSQELEDEPKSKKRKRNSSIKDTQESIIAKTIRNMKKEQLDDVADITVPDLNISSLFNEGTSSNWQSTTFPMADNEDRGLRGRSSLSLSSALLNDGDFEFPEHSDVESLLGNVKKEKTKRKRKASASSSSDEFQVPVKKSRLQLNK